MILTLLTREIEPVFNINPSSGEISLSSEVDHDIILSRGSRSRNPVRVASVQIDVLNENDAAPQFVQDNVVRENSDDLQILYLELSFPASQSSC